MAKKKGYGDVAETLAPKVSSALSKYLVTFFSIKWLKGSMDAIDAYTLPISLLISWLLPEEGFLKVTSVITSETLAGLKREGENRLKDWDSAKRQYAYEEKPKGTKINDIDDKKDYDKFKKHLKFPSRYKSLAELRTKCGAVGKTIANALGKIDLQAIMNKIPSMPDFNAFEQWLDDQKIPEKLDLATDKINVSRQSKPLVKKNRLSRFIDQQTRKINP